MSVAIVRKGGGTLEKFGPNKRPWHVADDAYLKPAIDLAKTSPFDACRLADELVKEAGVTGVVRFKVTGVPVMLFDRRSGEPIIGVGNLQEIAQS